MKKYIFFLLISLVFISARFGKDKALYKIFDKNGKEVTYANMLTALEDKDLVLFGELHDNIIAHNLELQLTKDISGKRKLILGAEMFEADNQQAVTAYLKDSIDQKGLDTLARLWNNYKTDYKPLLDFAKANNLNFVATNIPRRYAKLVHKKGFEGLDSLTNLEKSWIAPMPLPFDPELPRYKEMLNLMGDHTSPNIVKAQASKDATMAYFILKNYEKNYLFLHFNGSYHSDYYEGINWYIKQQNDKLNIVTISVVTQKKLKKIKDAFKGRADFIVVVDDKAPKSF